MNSYAAIYGTTSTIMNSYVNIWSHIVTYELYAQCGFIYWDMELFCSVWNILWRMESYCAIKAKYWHTKQYCACRHIEPYYAITIICWHIE